MQYQVGTLMSTPIRFNATSGLAALGTLVAKLYPLDNDGLVNGTIANGAAGDACTEVETYVYQATVAESLTGWYKVIVELDGSATASTYVYMTPTSSTHWCGTTPARAVALLQAECSRAIPPSWRGLGITYSEFALGSRWTKRTTSQNVLAMGSMTFIRRIRGHSSGR